MLKHFAAAALTMGALASPSFAGEPNAADQCVNEAINDYFNRAARIQELPGVQLTSTVNLEELVSSCEKETDTASEFYKGMPRYTETRGNLTLILK